MAIFIKSRKGQSVLEYALLIGVVISALLIMQVFIKRHFQGSLKESAEKMGEQFSPSGTTTYSKRNLEAGQNQYITEETTTSAKIDSFVPAGVTIKHTLDQDAFSYSSREAGQSKSEQKTSTNSATSEKFKWSEMPAETVMDYQLQ